MPAKGWKNIVIREDLHNKLQNMKGKSFTEKIQKLRNKAEKYEELKGKYEHLLSNPNKTHGDPSNNNAKLPDLSCVYASWNNPEQRLVDCGRLLSKKGKVITLRYEACVKCFGRRTFVRKRREKNQQRDKAHNETNSDPDPEPTPPRTPTRPTLEEIVGQSGVCSNPLKAHKNRPLACVLCKQRDYSKWKACQEILKEIETQPLARKQFFDNMAHRTIERAP